MVCSRAAHAATPIRVWAPDGERRTAAWKLDRALMVDVHERPAEFEASDPLLALNPLVQRPDNQGLSLQGTCPHGRILTPERSSRPSSPHWSAAYRSAGTAPPVWRQQDRRGALSRCTRAPRRPRGTTSFLGAPVTTASRNQRDGANTHYALPRPLCQAVLDLNLLRRARRRSPDKVDGASLVDVQGRPVKEINCPRARELHLRRASARPDKAVYWVDDQLKCASDLATTRVGTADASRPSARRRPPSGRA